jgi:DNA polymerase-4
VRLAHGIDPRPVRADRRPRSLGAEETFAQDRRPAEAEAHLLAQAERVARRLRACGLCAHTVGLKVRLGGRRFTTLTRRHTLAEATADEAVLFAVARRFGPNAIQRRLPDR